MSCAHPGSHGDLWLQRPLPKEYLHYAARDMYAINLLFEHFKEVNYINPALWLLQPFRQESALHHHVARRTTEVLRPIHKPCVPSTRYFPSGLWSGCETLPFLQPTSLHGMFFKCRVGKSRQAPLLGLPSAGCEVEARDAA